MSTSAPLDTTSGWPPKTEDEARRQVAAACRMLARYGHEDLTLGHVSVRGPGEGDVFIKAKGKALGEVTPNDVLRVQLEHEDAHRAPGAHLETVLHLEAYRARPDVGAAIHTHPLYATTLGATFGSLAYLSHDAVLFREGVGLFSEHVGMITTPDDGCAVAAALGPRRAVLLKNHGVLVVGEDVRWAVLAAVTLERAATVQLIAGATAPLSPIPESDLDEIRAAKYQEPFLDEYWAAWTRMLAAPAARTW